MMRAPVYDRWGVQVHHGDCLDVLREFPDGHFSAVITDPPYSYRFMGKSWDAHESPLAFQQWCERWARECLRVLRPGGHLLAFGGARTAHRLTCGIEDAKSEIRDGIDWLYAGGMPKGNNISKAIDRQAGAEREVIGEKLSPDGVPSAHSAMETTPATDAARRWEGWNTQLRPAHELITVARKPFRGSVAANVLAHGTGGINVDACRVGTDVITQHGRSAGQSDSLSGPNIAEAPGRSWTGRWPPNVVLSHVPSVDPDTGEVVGDACADGCVDGCPVRELDQQSGITSSTVRRPTGRDSRGIPNADGMVWRCNDDQQRGVADSGGGSRFFPRFRFEAKAPTHERPRVAGESHSTVKPIALMRWLVRLVTPPGGIALDCFAGTGVTGQAARAEGFEAVLIDNDPAAIPWIVARLDAHPREDKPTPARPAAGSAQPDLFTG